MTTLARRDLPLAEVGILASIGCVVAAFGLFGTDAMPLGARMAYWIFGLIAAWLLVRALAHVGAAMARMVGAAEQWGYVIAVPLSSIGIAWAVLWLKGGVEAALGHGFALIWPQVMLVGFAFFLLFFVLYARAERLDAAQPLVDTPQYAGVDSTTLHEHLPIGFPPILALTVEDHYVRAIADGRDEMLLMSLTQAASLLPEDAGRQVHRSWWVAHNSVHSHKREGRDIKLELTNGTLVPVSRSRVAELRDANWI